MPVATALSSTTRPAGGRVCVNSTPAVVTMDGPSLAVGWQTARHAIATRSLVCSRGAIAIEFALIAPVLLMLLAGMVEFGNVYLVKNQMSEVARETARRIATDKLTPDGAIAFVGTRLADTIDSTIGVTVTETSLGDDGSADLTVVLSVPLADVMTFGFWLPIAAAAAPSADGELTPADSDGASEPAPQPMMLETSATMLKE